MSPFALYFHDLRTRHGLRLRELAERMGYEQTYLSAFECGTKGPPNEEFVGKLIQAMRLDEQEQAKLRLAVHESKKTYLVPIDAPEGVFRMVSELWDALESLQPAEVEMIRRVTRFKAQLQSTPPLERRRIVREQKEVAKM